MSAVRVVLVDSGGSNIGSVQWALRRLGVEAPFANSAAQIVNATHVILPGVGAAGPAMTKLRASGLDHVLREIKTPLLGVCLGMQLLFEHSEEDDVACLGLLKGQASLFNAARCGRVPHMGWNNLLPKVQSPLLKDIGEHDYAYFVHSYAVPLVDSTLAAFEYGGLHSAVVGDGRVFGAQFHPERSATTGSRLLQNFLEIRSCK